MLTYMNPLGKYSQQVAAIVALGSIGAAITLRFLGLDDDFIDSIALLALGAVFGSAATTAVNGGKIEAAHRRLDVIQAPPADVYEQKAIDEVGNGH